MRARTHRAFRFTDLARRLGIPGQIIRLWSENDADYLHVIAEWDGDPHHAPEGFHETVDGGHVDIYVPHETESVVLIPGTDIRVPIEVVHDPAILQTVITLAEGWERWCPQCGGTGSRPASTWQVCSVCEARPAYRMVR